MSDWTCLHCGHPINLGGQPGSVVWCSDECMLAARFPPPREPGLTAEEIALLDESVADLDVDGECYQSWRPPWRQ